VLSSGIDNTTPVHGTPQTFNIGAATSYTTLTQTTTVTCDLVFFAATDSAGNNGTRTPPTSFTEDHDVNYMHTCHRDAVAAGSVSATGGSQTVSGQIQGVMVALANTGGGSTDATVVLSPSQANVTIA
jgi:hypothetical protein